MPRKIAASIRVVMIAVLVAVGTLAIAAFTMTSLEVHCDLQEDQFYTCQSRDTLLGVTLSEVNAEQVYAIERDLTCTGSGRNRGCSARAEFKTATGDLISLSKMYTDPDQVQKAVGDLTPLLSGKSTPIDMTFPPSTFVSVVIISVASCVFILLLFVALIMLFGKDVNELQPRAIDLRKKN